MRQTEAREAMTGPVRDPWPTRPRDGVGCGVWLVTPGVSPGRFASAADAGADVALLDLEDSVPLPRKAEARGEVLGFLCRDGQDEDRASGIVGVRVNAPDTVHGLKDLVELAEHGVWPALLLVPKVRAARDVELVARIMDGAPTPTQVWALIESPRAIQHLPDILCAPALTGVVFGAADYAAEARCAITSRSVGNARMMLVAAAAAAGLPAVDSPYFDLSNAAGLRREACEAADLGFVGKVAIHPAQLPVIREAFQPSQAELDTARAVVAAADAADGGIITIGGAMVGPPIADVARALIARAGAPALRLAHGGRS